MPTAAHFSPRLFAFLRELKRHNDRDWFAAHKERYERDVREPMLRFIADAAEPLGRISRAISADPRPSGGSLFPIHRDTRFSKDKSPYKTHAAAHFRHRAAKDVHAPGYYLHLEPGRVLAGVGLWRPDPPTLLAIRAALVRQPDAWKKAIGGKAFRAACRMDGESAARVPRGFPADHPLAEDLKRKDFTALADFTEREAASPAFLKRYVEFCRATAALNAFLAEALGLDW
jgi:uncharacterized protein (TIGR02453 family)